MPKALERPETFVGTWEEVTEQAGDLSGKRVTLTVHPEAEYAAEQMEASEGAPRNLAEWLAPLLEEADRLKPEPPVPHTDPDEVALDAIMRKKAERLGLEI